MWPFSSKFGRIKSIPDGHWAVAQGQNGEELHILRINTWVLKRAGHPDYPHLIRVIIRFPSDLLINEINEPGSPCMKFEERLFTALQNNAESMVVAVHTILPHSREFVVHSRDAAAAAQRLKFIFADFQKLKPSQATENDPGWAFARRTCQVK